MRWLILLAALSACSTGPQQSSNEMAAANPNSCLRSLDLRCPAHEDQSEVQLIDEAGQKRYPSLLAQPEPLFQNQSFDPWAQ